MTDNCKENQCLDIPRVKNTDCPEEPEKTPVIFGNAELLGGDTSPIELTAAQIKLLCEGIPACTEITPDVIRAYNTAIYWLGQQAIDLCNQIKNINAATLFDTPITVFDIAQARSSGDYDSGIVSMDLNSLSGVSVPQGATAAILRASTSISGQNMPAGNLTDIAYVQIEAASTASLMNGGNVFSVGKLPTLISFTDTDLAENDNDNTNDAFIKLDGSSISYRANIRFSDTSGIDTGIARVYLVGFI